MQNKESKHNKLGAYKWLRQNLVGHRLPIWILAILNCITSIILLAFAFLSKQVLDIATGNAEGNFKTVAIILVGVIIIQVILLLVNINLKNDVVLKSQYTLKNNMMSCMLNTKYSDIMAYHVGELLTRLSSDVSIVIGHYINLIVMISSFVSRLILGITALILMSKTFTLVFLAIMLVFFFLGRFYGRYVKKLHRKVQIADGQLRSCMTESLNNIPLIKGFCANDMVMRAVKYRENRCLHAIRKKVLFTSGSSSAVYFMFTASYYVALIYGAMCIAKGSMTFGSLTAFLLIINQIQTPLKSMVGMAQQFYEILSSAERLMDFIDLPKEEEQLEVKDFNKLVVKDISFSYDKQIFNNFNFTLNKGEIVGIRGESGRGKTSFINILLGFYNVDEGEIYIENDEGKIPVNASTRNYFSLCPQGNQILSGNIYSNIAFNNKCDNIDELLNICCLTDVVNDSPKGLKTYIGERGYGLSEGQVQRICLARAINADKPILLLDEFTSALDIETEKKILKNIKKLGKTCIIISHKESVFSICDRVIDV